MKAIILSHWKGVVAGMIIGYAIIVSIYVSIAVITLFE